MPVLEILHKGDYLCFDEEQCAVAGHARAEEYQTATPFPHIVMDDFLDSAILRDVAREFPNRAGQNHFDREQERLKYQFPPKAIESARIRNLLAELNSAAFLVFLEAMTGIEGLIPDPHYVGAGLHETLTGGHLGIHADFNIHGKLSLERRLNLLVYLNDDWDPSFGGALELWDKKMRAATRSVLPTLGTAVVFNTDRRSFHGHPDPLTCPADRSRLSVATYYYTAIDRTEYTPKRTTTFQVRPDSTDQVDVSVAVDSFLTNWMPPRLQAPAKRLAAQDCGYVFNPVASRGAQMIQDIKLLIFIEATLATALIIFYYCSIKTRNIINLKICLVIVAIPLCGVFFRDRTEFYVFLGLIPLLAFGNARNLAGIYLLILPQFPALSDFYSIGSHYLFHFSAIYAFNLGAIIALMTVRRTKARNAYHLDAACWLFYFVCLGSSARGVAFDDVFCATPFKPF